MHDLNSQDTPAADRRGWELPRPKDTPEQIEVGPGTLGLIADFATQGLLVRMALDAHILDKGHDPAKKWKLRLLGAVIVSDDGGSSETSGSVGAGRHTETEGRE